MAEHGGADNLEVSKRRPKLEEESTALQKAKESPYVPLGILGTLGMIGYGVYNFKNRGSMSPSVYIMHFRVRAQSMVVGAICLGLGYKMLKDYYDKHEKKFKETKM